MNDPHQWLEDVDGAEAMAWVRARNETAEAAWFDTSFHALRAEILQILEAEDRIPYPTVHGDDVHNVWTDARNPRGVLRRTTWADYASGEPDWEVLLDVDELGRAEDQSWVLHGTATRRPDRDRMLIDLSPGGSDADVTREFDLHTRRFVDADDGGFERPLGKGACSWIDRDAVYAMTELGSGTLTRSGYPRQVRRWERGTSLADAPVVFEGDESDISVYASVSTVPGHRHHLVRRGLDFYTSEYWLLVDGDPVRVEVPVDVIVSVHERWFTFLNRKAWTVDGRTHPEGSVLVAPVDDFLAGGAPPTAVFTPTERRALSTADWTRNHLVLTVLDDVRERIEVATPPDGADGTWSMAPLDGAPDTWCLATWPVDRDELDDLWVVGNDLLHPETLERVTIGGTSQHLRDAPPRFDTTGLRIEQRFATSADGTRVPYFEVGGTRSEPGPTLLGGYGGFEVARQPAYTPVLGHSWLAAGGTYVLANIRGGGEYGPRWHQAGLRDQRPRVYEDFEAVARDLIDRGVTTPSQLGCTGGSNGGLLVGNMYVRSPELWGAVVCQVPLLDMARYHLLLAGASWMAEYGDPDDPDDWAFLQTYSPYHLVDEDGSYPPILLTTSTRDDRVHPGHARKMAARLEEFGHDVTYWENIEGGHGGAADAKQAATMQALVYRYLRRTLGLATD